MYFFCKFLIAGERLNYDKNFKGPLRKRSCTDLTCLFIFIIFLGCWGFVAHYGELARVFLQCEVTNFSLK